jgi:signal peptidase II
MDERQSIPAIPASRHVVFWSLAAVGLAADLGSKAWMFSRPDLLAGGVRWVWPGHAGFQLSLNEGALFGMGQGGVWVFAACALTAAIAIPVWLFVFGGARDAALTAVLGCILGGVLGNLYDRVGLPGLQWSDFMPNRAGPVYAVRDFILLARRWPPESRWDVWPNFNIADALLVCGAIALVLLSLRKPPVEAVDGTHAATSGRTGAT